MKIEDFLDGVLNAGQSLVIKRLSANDTGATASHQAGPYIPKAVAFALCPALNTSAHNPDHVFPCCVSSHSANRTTRLVWYNGGTRDECRITRWADDKKKNSVIDESQTGGIVVMGFETSPKGILQAWAWFCSSEDEERLVEDRFEVIEPGVVWFRHHGKMRALKTKPDATLSCSLTAEALPPDWLAAFPDASQIIEKTLSLTPSMGLTPDQRLLRRRSCEFELFKSIENFHVLPAISSGFTTIEAFVDLANSVTNRRKSRSGRSLELHLEHIFNEVSLTHSHGATTERKNTPDFLFPSAEKYRDAAYPTKKLRMLAAKTTCKDRWRQILEEADRIPNKHLATLQEGVSVSQFKQMNAKGVVLVVPKGLHKSFPEEVRPELRTLESFVKELKALYS